MASQTKTYTQDELVTEIRGMLPKLVEDPKTKNRGWDLVQECWTDEEIKAALGRSCKLSGALWAVEQRLAPVVEARQEHEEEAKAGA